MSNPQLSIVLTGRNDNHSAGFEERLTQALDFNRDELRRRGIDFEIVWVEWNAVPDKPPQGELVVSRYPEARAIVASAAIHEAACEDPRMRFMQYMAKNIGVRRARGRHILTTNADIVLGGETLDRMAELVRSEPRLRVYRATRRDLGAGTLPSAAADPALWTRLNRTTPPYRVEQSGDFILAARAVWHALRGFNERVRNSELHIDSQLCVQAVEFGIAVEILGDAYHLYHPGSWTHLPPSRRDAPSERGVNFDFMRGVPYDNAPDWGMAGLPTRPIAERIEELVGVPAFSPPGESESASAFGEIAADLRAKNASLDEDDFCAEWIRSAGRLRMLGPRSEAGFVPVLRAFIREKWKSLSAFSSIALYGSGRHTVWLLDVVSGRAGPKVAAILDDYAEPGQMLNAISVIRPDDGIGLDIEAVVISSDVYEDVLAARARDVFPSGTPIIRLYDGLPAGLYLYDRGNDDS